MATAPNVPQFDGRCITWNERRFLPWYGEHPERAFREVNHFLLPEPHPGEEIVPARGGLYFLGMPFLPEGTLGRKDEIERVAQLVREEGKIAARQARHAKQFQPTQIPVELEPEIAARQARGDSTRKIAQWLLDEKGIDTSHASVGRAGSRHRLRQARDQGESTTRDRLQEQHQEFDRVMEEMDRLRESALADLLAGDGPDPAVEACFRMAHRQATLLQRDIRETGRHLTLEQREVPRARPMPPADPPAPSEKPSIMAGLAGLAVALFITFGSWPCAASPKVALSAAERPSTAVLRTILDSRRKSEVTRSGKALTGRPFPFWAHSGKGRRLGPRSRSDEAGFVPDDQPRTYLCVDVVC